MTINEVLCDLSIETNEEVTRNTKVKQMVKYVLEHVIQFDYEFLETISAESFLRFMENIYSVEKAVNVLKDEANRGSINCSPENVAKFFNMYPAGYTYPGDKIFESMTDGDILKVFSLEWVVENILNAEDTKAIRIEESEVVVFENEFPEDDDVVYVPTKRMNSDSILKAKELKLLEKVYDKVS